MLTCIEVYNILQLKKGTTFLSLNFSYKIDSATVCLTQLAHSCDTTKKRKEKKLRVRLVSENISCFHCLFSFSEKDFHFQIF